VFPRTPAQPLECNNRTSNRAPLPQCERDDALRALNVLKCLL